MLKDLTDLIGLFHRFASVALAILALVCAWSATQGLGIDLEMGWWTLVWLGFAILNAVWGQG